MPSATRSDPLVAALLSPLSTTLSPDSTVLPPSATEVEPPRRSSSSGCKWRGDPSSLHISFCPFPPFFCSSILSYAVLKFEEEEERWLARQTHERVEVFAAFPRNRAEREEWPSPSSSRSAHPLLSFTATTTHDRKPWSSSCSSTVRPNPPRSHSALNHPTRSTTSALGSRAPTRPPPRSTRSGSSVVGESSSIHRRSRMFWGAPCWSSRSRIRSILFSSRERVLLPLQLSRSPRPP